MRTTIAEPHWNGFLAHEVADFDRAPGLPLVGFISGTVISLGLWAAITMIIVVLL